MTSDKQAPAVKQAQAPAAPTLCQYCNKPLTRSGSVDKAHGARCQFVKATLGNAQAQSAHIGKYTSASIANNAQFVKLAAVSASIKANGLTTVSRFVTAFGTDKNTKAPKHITLTPIYAPNRTRYVHKFWLNKGAQTMLATNQFDKVPAKVTSAVQAALAKAAK